MRDLSETALDFPERPDWVWLGWFWRPVGLYRDQLMLQDAAAEAEGKLACLASPYAQYGGGPVLAADIALEWMGQLAGSGVLPLSPAYIAHECGQEEAKPENVLRYADLVIIPPVPGWHRSACVWRAVCCALADHKPVYLLNGGADG